MKGILILSDSVYAIPKSKVNIVELIRHNSEKTDISYRYIVGDNSSSIATNLSNNIENLSEFVKNYDSVSAFVMCGLSECEYGYSAPLFESHLDGIVSELIRLGFSINLINCEITNGLKGRTGGWFRRASEIISRKCEELNCIEIKPSIFLNINNKVPELSIEATREIVTKICYSI